MISQKKTSQNQNTSTNNKLGTNGTETSLSKNNKKFSQTSRGTKKLHPLSNDQMSSPSVAMNPNSEERIAARAYEIYEERIRLGASLQDWLRAEREVMAMMEFEG